jgi:hypothetical protein
MTAIEERHNNLKRFLDKWTIEAIENMTLQDYTNVGNKDSFCYWLEHETRNLGEIGGTYSSMFGIWHIKNFKKGKSLQYIDDKEYKWYAKYGESRDIAFSKIKENILNIIENVKNNSFQKIDEIDYFSLVKWKIAFIYSNYKLLPVYVKEGIRKIARNFDHLEYNTAPIYQLHQFILEKKDESKDIFEFSYEQYFIAVKEQEKSYYIIGSKYGDGNGNNNIDIAPKLYEHNIISTGFFGGEDLAHLFGKGKTKIDKWLDKNLKNKYPNNYNNAKRTLSFFLGIEVGDIIAVKSHGQYGDLTIIAYAEVKEVGGSVYYHSNENGLGHCINVSFFEKNLYRNVGLSYGRTIHYIVPDQRKDHFEKIFGSYSFSEVSIEENGSGNIELTESRINDKQTESKKREVAYTATVRHIHNKIQSSFAENLQKKHPNDYIRTEHKYIDVVRQNDTELFYYEVKPFNSVYNCIRSGIGQLLDYYYKNPHNERSIHIRIVGSEKPTDEDEKFIDFLKNSLNISFDYISHRFQ